jgi:glycopeptide antibiotics resistance protein
VIAGVIAIAVNADAKVIWTCVSGVMLGLIGIRYTIRRDRRSGI